MRRSVASLFLYPNARFIGRRAQLRYQLPFADISDYRAWVSTGNGNARCSMPPGRSRSDWRRRDAARRRSHSRCCAPTSCRAASRRDRACPRPSSPSATGWARRRSAARWCGSPSATGCSALPRRGYLVKPITLRDIGEIFALRRMIEPVAVAPRGRRARRQPAAPARRGVRQPASWRGDAGEPGDLPAGAPPAASRDRHRRRQ